MENQDKQHQRNESLLARSLRANGYLFPIIAEQVEFLEQHHEQLFAQAPTGLTSGEDILRRGLISFNPLRRDLIDPQVEHSLAQAAREGKEIPDHVREQMQRDRLDSNTSEKSSDTDS